MKKLLTLSLIVNLILITLISVVIIKKGGITYFKHIKLRQRPHQEDTSYYNLRTEMYLKEKIDSGSLVFLGDSYIDIIDWDELFPEFNIYNRGIIGDVIPMILGRIDTILLTKPSKIFIIIGTNDINRGYPIDTILANYKLLLDKIKRVSPNSKVYVHSIAPTLYDVTRPNKIIISVNKLLKPLVEQYNYTYINLFNHVKSKNDELLEEFTHDGLHLNKKGYLVWKELLEPYIIE